MNFSINIVDYSVKAFGITTKEEFIDFALGKSTVYTEAKNPKPEFIPMMTARRLSQGCRLAVDIGLKLNSQYDIEAVIYSSRSGELEHNYKVLESNVNGVDCSPTDFSMSVHNCAVGNFTILSKKKIPSSSITAGTDSFMQALTDAYIMLKAGYKKVLLVDFDVNLPQFFKDYIEDGAPTYPFAVGFVLELGDQINISTAKSEKRIISDLPLSMIFAKNFASNNSSFSVQGEKLQWDILVK